MRRIFHDNGLSIVLLGLFILTLGLGQFLTGHHEYNNQRKEHGLAPVTLPQYLRSAHCLEATMENWESEFLQMGLYVILTAFLFQRGSSESKNPSRSEEVDRDPALSRQKDTAPWPVKRGGWVLKVYQHSLSLAFLFLFLMSFALHAVGGARNHNEEQRLHGQQSVSVAQYMKTSRFWFESFQNWQSEFLAIGSMVVLSIFLRQRGSPESKPVDSPHWQTGTEDE